MKILALNAGSSSLKAAVYEMDPGEAVRADASPTLPLWQANADWSRTDAVPLTVRTLDGEYHYRVDHSAPAEVFARVLREACQGDHAIVRDPGEIEAIGHRVVHGGSRFRETTIVTSAVKEEIRTLESVAPAHNELALEGIEAATRLCPQAAQIAVFDTAFYASLPPVAYVYPGPYEWVESGIRRYGFHGISHSFALSQAGRVLGKDPTALQVISCHLGSGCSVTATSNGVPVATSMGFTPLEGLMMSTRSGSVDPGILIHLLDRKRLSLEQLNQMLNHSSGLLGISGVSGDIREVLRETQAGNPRAQLALDLYVRQIQMHIGAMLPILDRLDVLVFTGGVGENCAPIREDVCKGLTFLGLELDADVHSADTEEEISSVNSSVRVLVIRAREEWVIAREAALVAATAGRPS